MAIAVFFTRDGAQRRQSGVRSAIVAPDAASGDARPNCHAITSAQPFEFLPALEDGDWILRLHALRPNVAMVDKIELCLIGHRQDGWHELGHLRGDLALPYPHIDMWGGCCGPWDKHLAEIARNVRAAA